MRSAELWPSAAARLSRVSSRAIASRSDSGAAASRAANEALRAAAARAGSPKSPRRIGASTPARACARRLARSSTTGSSSGWSSARASSIEREARRVVERDHAGGAGQLAVRLRQVTGHAGGGLPDAESQRHARPAPRTTALGERVEHGVGRRVVALAGEPERRGGGRVQHELGEVEVACELIQVDRRIHLRTHHPTQPLAVERGDQPVVERARGVHDGRERMLGGDLRDHTPRAGSGR